MGKWKGKGGGGGGGGGKGEKRENGSGGGGSGSKRHNANSMSSCRGKAIIVATCDTARERESNKELMNLLTLGVEQLVENGLIPEKYVSPFKSGEAAEGDDDEDLDDDDNGGDAYGGSMADLLAAEVSQLKESGSSATALHSIQLSMKGVVLVKIQRPDIDPVLLLRVLFDRIERERSGLSRHLIRLIPCAKAFYPNEVELISTVRVVLRKTVAGVKLPKLKLPELKPAPAPATEATEAAEDKDKDSDEPAAKKARGVGDRDVSQAKSLEDKEGQQEQEQQQRSGGLAPHEERPDKETVLALRAERKRMKGLKSATEAEEERAEQVQAIQRAEALELSYQRRQEAAAERGEVVPEALSFSLAVDIKCRHHNHLSKEIVKTWVGRNLPAAPEACVKSGSADVSMIP